MTETAISPAAADGTRVGCDILVIGGGPGGSAVAILLAQAGLDVVLVEKDTHPRFHIGESLLPHSLPVLERLGVIDAVRKIGVYKPGAEFVSADGTKNPIFLFARALRPGPDHAYQVRRATFDQILFERARAVGVRAHDGATATIERSDDAGGIVSVRFGDGTMQTFEADLLVDASGRTALTARMHAEQSADRKHNTAAIFAHFRGVPAFAGERGGNIRIHLTDPGWMWQIPLTDGVTSIGLVMPGDRIARREGTVEAFFDNHVARNPEITRLLERAERVGELRTTGNFSYRASRAFGPGHVRVGDAFGFIDPIFSTGVHLALIGAEDAAYAILAARKQPARRSRYLMEYDRKVQRRIRYVSWFIYSIHDTSFRQLLLNPCNLFGIESAIISLLAGDFSPDRRTGIRVLLFKAIRKVAQLKKSFEDRGIGYAR